MRVAVALVLAGSLGPACSDSDEGTERDGSVPRAIDAATDGSDATAMPDAAADAGTSDSSTLRFDDTGLGIGFDDLQYSATLDRLIVPTGRAGFVALVDPLTRQVTRLGDLSSTDSYAGGHGYGTTSAIEAEGLVYAIDRTAALLVQLDPGSGDTLATVALGGAPDYVRYVRATRELWVTEPGAGRFEIFALGSDDPPSLEASGELAVSGGPESMVIGADGTTAYTNTFVGQTIRIDTVDRSERSRWSNGCAISLGLALDDANGRIFAGCAEGKAVAMDATSGEVVSTLVASGGVDIIAYSATLSHLYLNGSTTGELTVAGVADDSTLTELAMVPTAASSNSSCVASDPYHGIWVCDANAGQLLRITDDF